MSEESIANRLKLFIEMEGLTNSQFADNCGIARPSLSQLLNGRNKKISDVLINQIHQGYPDLNIMWLLFGEGSQKLGESSSYSTSNEELHTGHKSSDEPTLFDSIEFNSDFSEGENRNSLRVGKKSFVNQILTPLSQSPDKTESISNEYVDAIKETKFLKAQIEKLQHNPRKVVQIMVYYDDSTFETFIPNS